MATNEFTPAKPEAEVFAHVAALMRKVGKLPSQSQMRYAKKQNPAFPNPTASQRRFGYTSKFVEKLKEWAADTRGYEDIPELLESTQPKHQTTRQPRKELSLIESGGPALDESYIPPVIQSLAALAAGDERLLAECRARGPSSSVEFERRVGIAFRILGFDVQDLGQGRGRVADGIARYGPGHWALVRSRQQRIR